MRLNVDVTRLPQPYTLNDVVCWFSRARGRREEAYVRLRSMIKDANFEAPRALRRLASITEFDLFVSTTFDPLLEMAINLERFGGAPPPKYSPMHPIGWRICPASVTSCSGRWFIICSAVCRRRRPM